ncbi:MAG: 16S rRNA (cytidine(1402)-2'-O)-methyltransferase [bacterium]|nr:16S rRNA (cytidine(1402)-2'-O)-methyltransferase [bacterium]
MAPFNTTQGKGKLSIVATPIGNLEDITLRALRTLKECDVVYAEDTRVVAKLLARYEIKKPLQRLDAAKELEKAKTIVERLEAGEHVVFVSDAGTPGIADPGARLVAFVREHAPKVKIEAIPGASALTAALSIAGVDASEFIFLGFLPHKKGRQTTLKKIATGEYTVVLYESPHRILKLLQELDTVGIQRVTIARELTKVHEEVLVGTPVELAKDLEARGAARGEFVVIVSVVE